MTCFPLDDMDKEFLEPAINYISSETFKFCIVRSKKIFLVVAMHVIGRTLNTRQTFF